MLLVRRGAPEGGYFTDSDRAAGIFGVLATGFSVLLGFLIFLGFESYDASRSGAETEALTVAQQIQTAQSLPSPIGAELTGELVCYARSVIHGEWDRMENSTLGEDINPWGAAMFRTLQARRARAPRSRTPPTASGWTRPRPGRRPARTASTARPGVMPTPMWIALFFISAIVLGFLLGFADSGDRVWVQGHVHGQRRGRDRHHAAAAARPRPAVPRRHRRAQADRDGTHRAAHRPAAGGDRRGHHDPLRRRPGSRHDRDRRGDRTGGGARPGAAGLDRDRRHRALGGRGGGHRLEQLPGQPVERRSQQGRRPGQRPAHRRRPGPRAGPRPDPGRHRPVHPMGQRLHHRPDAAGRLLHRTVPTGVQARLRRLAGHRAAHDAWRAADTLRHGRVPAPSPDRRGAPRRAKPTRRRSPSSATSNAPPTTSSASSSSPSPCSSPA